MNCPRCGAAFSEGKFFCENCGERRPTYFSPAQSVSAPEYQVKTEEKPAPEVSAPVFSPAAPPPSETKSDSNRTRNIVIISSAAVILVALILLLSIQIGKDNLKKSLCGIGLEWKSKAVATTRWNWISRKMKLSTILMATTLTPTSQPTSMRLYPQTNSESKEAMRFIQLNSTMTGR